MCYYGSGWFLNLIVVPLVFQCLQDTGWTHSWRGVPVQQNQQRHNVLLRSALGRLSVFCQCPPPKLLLLSQSFPHSVALACWCCPDFPSSPSLLFLARRPARTRFQVQGPVPEPRYGRPCHSERRHALPVASMGAQLRAGGPEAPGGASVLREGSAGPRHLHRGLHLHPDPHTHRPWTGRTRRPGPEGDRTHLRQFSVWHPGAHGDRWVQVLRLRLRLCSCH